MTPTSREDRAHKNAEKTRPDRASSKTDKARALLDRDGIAEKPGRTFLAKTLGTDHNVALYDDGTTSCTCIAGRNGVECYAVLAAQQLAADNPSMADQVTCALDGVEWTPGTLDAVAEILRRAGRRIGEPS